jgi:IS1 family transposase/transposase-like protein
MTITIEISCPHCHSKSIKRNGKKRNGKQNYICKECRHQFLGQQDYSQNGRKKDVLRAAARALTRGSGIRDIRAVFQVSFAVIYKIIKSLKYDYTPKKKHYSVLEIDEFWTYVAKKANKVWLIYAYDRESGEIAAHVWGKRDLKTAKKLRKRLLRLGISYDALATDNWESFIGAFKQDKHLIGKKYTVGIEGNNCRLRHRNRRFFRKTCCFSKRLYYHWKIFAAVVCYINTGFFLMPAYLL